MSGQFIVLEYKEVCTCRVSKGTADDTNEKITRNFRSECVVKPRYWKRTIILKAGTGIVAAFPSYGGQTW